MRGEEGGQAPGTHPAAPHRIWRTTGEHHGGHGEVSAPASCELRDTRRRHSLPSLSDRGPLEVCSAQPAHPAVNSGPRSPKPPRCPVVCPVPSPGPLRTDLHSHSSLAQRSDFLELDCQLTRDGVVVVSHDKNLSRQSGVNRDVSSLDFEVGLAPAPPPPTLPREPRCLHACPLVTCSLFSPGAAPLQGGAGGLLLTR